ncbi:MAG: M23 family metallopeptidase [Bacilli bacterium]|nr:M23 family metallopeptidase [Bacilli bacterium]
MEERILKERLVLKKSVRRFITQSLLTIIVTLILLIGIKQNPSLKAMIHNKVYEENIPFMKIKDQYESLFGNYLSVDKISSIEKPVFQEKIQYTSLKKQKNGVVLEVEENYLVPSIKDGVVVYIGEKEEYGKCIILEQTDGVDVIYGNLKEINVNMYDYIDQGKLLGVAEKELYMEFQREGKTVEYQKYL